MDTFKSFNALLSTVNEDSFENIALELFRFQADSNALYKTWLKNLAVRPDHVKSLVQIPFMPISFFKTHEIMTLSWRRETEFTSSGTTGSDVSRHAVFDLQVYLDHAVRCFSTFFGDLRNYHIFALLPSYLERTGSSLVAMIDHFIRCTQSEFSGFYLGDQDRLLRDIDRAARDDRKIILWGVTFALLDLAAHYKPDLSRCMIFETGGMKGRRQEVTRRELHAVLRKDLNVSEIYSEYGMTELFSQAYTRGGENFYCPPSMKILCREIADPANKGLVSETGGINIIDLANWHSIGFIETEDLGKLHPDGSFEILGRMDNSDVRGCNLLME